MDQCGSHRGWEKKREKKALGLLTKAKISNCNQISRVHDVNRPWTLSLLACITTVHVPMARHLTRKFWTLPSNASQKKWLCTVQESDEILTFFTSSWRAHLEMSGIEKYIFFLWLQLFPSGIAIVCWKRWGEKKARKQNRRNLWKLGIEFVVTLDQ